MCAWDRLCMIKKNHFFTHESENNKLFKVVLDGLERAIAIENNAELIPFDLKCNDVKSIVQKSIIARVLFYIVFFFVKTVHGASIACVRLWKRYSILLFAAITCKSRTQGRNQQGVRHKERTCCIKLKHVSTRNRKTAGRAANCNQIMDTTNNKNSAPRTNSRITHLPLDFL